MRHPDSLLAFLTATALLLAGTPGLSSAGVDGDTATTLAQAERLLGQGQVGLAIELLRRLAEGDDQEASAQARERLLDAHQEQGRIAFEAGNLEDAYQHWSEALRINPQHRASRGGMDRLLERGEEIYLEGYMLRSLNPEAAVRSFERVISITPPDFEFHRRSKQRLAELDGPVGPAEGIIQRPPSRTPNSTAQARAEYERGRSLVQSNQFEDAAAHIENALALDPEGQSEAHALLGTTYIRLGDIDRGLVHYRVFLEKNPDHPQAGQVRSIIEAFDAQRR